MDAPTDPCDVLMRLRDTPELFEQLRAPRPDESELALQRRLRDQYPAELVRAALTQTELRQRGTARFTRAGQMWFTPKGLEQATAEAVAEHKARRFRGAVEDWCCGIGSDSVALARQGCTVTAVDLDPVCALLTSWNAAAFQVGELVSPVVADVTMRNPEAELLHIDPDRRPGPGRRVIRLEECLPPLEFLQQLPQRFKGGAMKLSPASNFGGKFEDCEIELISLHGECREATVWFGELAGGTPWRATVLPSGDTLAAEPLSAMTNVGPLEQWLYDPDPALVRSGLVDVLAEQLDLRRLDDAEEYLTSEQLVESPFLRPFEVLENVPNNEREIRQAVRRQGFGQVEIKCRHIPIEADQIRRRLPLSGIAPGVLIYTRQSGRARAVLCRRPASHFPPID